MKLDFIPVDQENRQELEQLRLLPEQKHYIESVRDCLAEADGSPVWRPVGIYDGNTPVGFAMYGFFKEYEPCGRVWLDRLLIDRRWQHRGYGKTAVQGLLQRLHREYDTREIYLSVYEDNQTAIHLYRELGFAFNGELDINGEKVMVVTLD